MDRKKIVLQVLVIVVFFVFFRIVKDLQNKSNLARQTSSVSTSAPAPACSFSDKNFCTFFAHLQNPDKYYPGGIKLSITSKSAAGVITNAVWQADSSNNAEMTTQNGANSSDLILVGTDIYTKDFASDSWNKSRLSQFNTSLNYDVDISNIKKFLTEKVVQKLSGSKVKFVDEEDCGGVKCLKYQIFAPAVKDSTEFIYINSDDLTLIKTHSEAKDGYMEDSVFEKSDTAISAPFPVNK